MFNLSFLRNYKTQIAITLLLMLMLMAFAIASPATFLGWSIYEAFLSTIPFFAIPAIAMTLSVVCGEMDMCFPSTIAISGFAFAWVWTSSGSGLLSIGAGLAAGTLVG
jgi:simple sugar transport system permease protein